MRAGSDVQGESLGAGFGDASFAPDGSRPSTPESEPLLLNTPRRRTPSGKDNRRQSLAFELAQASPGKGGGVASLAAELGLESHDEELEDDDSIEDGFRSDQDEERSTLKPGTPLKSSKTGVVESPKAPDTSPARLPRDIVSASEPHIDLEALDAELVQSTTVIQQDLSTMTSFLSSLSTYTSDAASSIAPTSKTADRQQILERLTSELIKSMYSMAKEREAQCRELQELGRQASRTEPDWTEALAEEESLPSLDWQVFSMPSDAPTPASGLGGISEDAEEENDHSDIPARTSATPVHLVPSFGSASSPVSPTSVRSSNSILTKPSGTPYLHGSMTSLRGQTGDVIGSLGGINEHIQVHRAGLTDVGRKIKSLKTTLSSFKSEAEAMDRSVEFVEGWEALRASRQMGFAQEAKSGIEEAEKILGQARKKAASILQGADA